MNVLQLIGRDTPLFSDDIAKYDTKLRELVESSRFLVIGAAGSIGQAVSKEIFRRNPKALHAVDISENNLVELVREIRSTLGYIEGEFRTFALDCGGVEFEHLMDNMEGYDYVLNLSALKHVRSEKDPYTLMRLIRVNILNTVKIAQILKKKGVKKYFCVSTDKATNPVNMMGASKRIMEMFLMRESAKLPVSMARFANVAFSDGSLLHGFNQRFTKRQPISAPNDVRRYFISPQESGELCLMSCLLGENRDVFFPKLNPDLSLTKFSDIATRYLLSLGYDPYQCSSEQEARERSKELIAKRQWPVYFFESNTSGEKDFEEFYTSAESLDFEKFSALGIIKNEFIDYNLRLNMFENKIEEFQNNPSWNKVFLVDLFNEMVPEFNHKETGKYLDDRM